MPLREQVTTIPTFPMRYFARSSLRHVSNINHLSALTMLVLICSILFAIHCRVDAHAPTCIHGSLINRSDGRPIALSYLNHNATMDMLNDKWAQKASKTTTTTSSSHATNDENEFEPLRIKLMGIYENDAGKTCSQVGDRINVGSSPPPGTELPECSASGQTFDCYIVCAEKDIVTEEKIAKMNNELLPRLTSFIESTIRTRRLESDVIAPHNCLDFQIPVNQINSTTTDLLVVVGLRPANGLLGYALSCGFEQMFGRPVLGILNINPSHLNYDTESVWGTIIHEMTHILGFSSSLFGNFVDSRGQRRSLDQVLKTETRQFVDSNGVTYTKQIHKLTTPSLTESVRSHFGCDSIDGAELEEFGSTDVGSHFEARVFMNELMTSSTAYENFTPTGILSQFTRALLLDTGWYSIPQSFESLQYGRNTGCSILMDRCEEWNLDQKGFSGYFCDESSADNGEQKIPTCTFDMKSVGFCGVTRYDRPLGYYEHLPESTLGGHAHYDYCPMVVRNTNTDCTRPDVACFNIGVDRTTNGRDAKCLPFRCDESQLSVIVDNRVIPCPADDSYQRVTTDKLPKGYAYIDCPRGARSMLCSGAAAANSTLLPQTSNARELNWFVEVLRHILYTCSLITIIGIVL